MKGSFWQRHHILLSAEKRKRLSEGDWLGIQAEQQEIMSLLQPCTLSCGRPVQIREVVKRLQKDKLNEGYMLYLTTYRSSALFGTLPIRRFKLLTSCLAQIIKIARVQSVSSCEQPAACPKHLSHSRREACHYPKCNHLHTTAPNLK